MPIDPNIAFQYKGVEFPDPVNALAKTMQLQNMVQEQQLNALKLKKAGLDTRQNMYKQALSRTSTKDQAANVTKQMFADPVVGPYVSQFGTVDQAIAEIPDDPKDFNNFILLQSGASPLDVAKLKQGEAKIAGQQEATKAARESTEANREANLRLREMALGLQRARAIDEGLPPDMLSQPVEGGAGAAGMTGAGGPPPVPGLSPKAQRELAAKQAEANLPVNVEKSRQQLAGDYQKAQTALNNLDDVLNVAKSVKESPGLGGATGIQSRIFSIPAGEEIPIYGTTKGEAAQAETRLSALKGKVTAMGKDVASMTGKIGTIANQEWRILRDMIAPLDEAIQKGKTPTLEQIEQIETYAQRAKTNILENYNNLHSSKLEKFPEYSFTNQPSGNAGAVPSGGEVYWDNMKH